MRALMKFLVISNVMFAADSVVSKAAFDPNAAQELARQCEAIFDARKQEIALSLSQLQKEQSNLQVISTENTRLMKQREEQIKQKEEALKKMYADMKAEEAKKSSESQARLDEAKKILAQNEELLKQINGAKTSKLADSYAKMKDSKAAPILSAMPEDDAVTILLSLKPTQMGSILSQMQPDKAAQLTKLIQNFPNKAEQNAGAIPQATQPQQPQNEGITSQNATNANIPNTKSNMPMPSGRANPNGTTVY